jgi:hypothetical protein
MRVVNPRPPFSRQLPVSGLCHIDPAVLAQLLLQAKVSVAQTLLSVLVRLGTPEEINNFMDT